jgi:hypothetical protein
MLVPIDPLSECPPVVSSISNKQRAGDFRDFALGIDLPSPHGLLARSLHCVHVQRSHEPLGYDFHYGLQNRANKAHMDCVTKQKRRIEFSSSQCENGGGKGSCTYIPNCLATRATRGSSM